MKDIKSKVLELLGDKVNEVFFEMQNELDINNGDITPLGALELYNCTEKLADIIENYENN